MPITFQANESFQLVSSTGNRTFQSLPTTFTDTMEDGSGPSPGKLTCSVDGTLLDFSQLETPSHCWIGNQEPVGGNFVTVGIWYPGAWIPIPGLQPSGTGTGTGVIIHTFGWSIPRLNGNYPASWFNNGVYHWQPIPGYVTYLERGTGTGTGTGSGTGTGTGTGRDDLGYFAYVFQSPPTGIWILQIVDINSWGQIIHFFTFIGPSSGGPGGTYNFSQTNNTTGVKHPTSIEITEIGAGIYPASPPLLDGATICIQSEGLFLPIEEVLPQQYQRVRLSRSLGKELILGTGSGPLSTSSSLMIRADTAPCNVAVNAFSA